MGLGSAKLRFLLEKRSFPLRKHGKTVKLHAISLQKPISADLLLYET
jgi:hypothetical protein